MHVPLQPGASIPTTSPVDRNLHRQSSLSTIERDLGALLDAHVASHTETQRQGRMRAQLQRETENLAVSMGQLRELAAVAAANAAAKLSPAQPNAAALSISGQGPAVREGTAVAEGTGALEAEILERLKLLLLHKNTPTALQQPFSAHYRVVRKALLRQNASFDSPAVGSLLRNTVVVVIGHNFVNGVERCQLCYPM